MTERERRTGTGGTEDNVRDDLDETQRDRTARKATRKVEEAGEAVSGSDGGVKDNVRDDQAKTQRP